MLDRLFGNGDQLASSHNFKSSIWIAGECVKEQQASKQPGQQTYMETPKSLKFMLEKINRELNQKVFNEAACS